MHFLSYSFHSKTQTRADRISGSQDELDDESSVQGKPCFDNFSMFSSE